MKRLIQSRINIYNKLYKIANNDERELLAFLIQSEIPLEKDVRNLMDYQFMNQPLKVNIDKFLSTYPNSKYNGTLYRALSLNKDKLDINNLEESIKNQIYYNDNEGWSKSKLFVDGLKNNLNKVKGPQNGIMVKLKSNNYGIDLEKTFNNLMEKSPRDCQKMGLTPNNLVEVDKEQEVITSTPKNYEIYNLNEIKNNLTNQENQEEKKDKKPGRLKRLLPFLN